MPSVVQAVAATVVASNSFTCGGPPRSWRRPRCDPEGVRQEQERDRGVDDEVRDEVVAAALQAPFSSRILIPAVPVDASTMNENV